MLSGGPSGLDPSITEDATWFLDRAKPLIPIFEPKFGFADTKESLMKRIGDDPRQVAWPLMIFGPGEVARLGRQRLLDAPAWRVEELPYGGVWVQVWENPFDAPLMQVTALAKHLGLDARER